jgi:hypothetical protein
VGEIKLNIGSGQRPFKPPWINTDIQEKWRKPTEEAGCLWVDECNAWGGWTEPVGMIVLHQVLEHFGCGEADSLVGSCYGLLAPGGSLIISVPNMRELAKAWLIGRLSTQVYMTAVHGAFMGNAHDRHFWNYDEGSLKEYLSKWKWSRIMKFNFRKLEGADIAQDYWILGMECIK